MLLAPSEDEAMLDEIRRQIDWESSIYTTLRNNTTVLERNVIEKRQFLKKLEEEVMLKQRQLKIIQEKYIEFMRVSKRRRQRWRHRLLF